MSEMAKIISEKNGIKVIEFEGKTFKVYPHEITNVCPDCQSETHFCKEHQEFSEYLYYRYTKRNLQVPAYLQAIAGW